MQSLPEDVRKWILIVAKYVDISLLREIVIGGSKVGEPTSAGADTDLFIGVIDNTAFRVAEALRTRLARTSTQYLISTLSYRTDFGLRVRVAKSPTDCCSYFFYDRLMVRNVAHWRHGIRLWTNKEQGEIRPTNESASSDQTARQEEFTDGLLEIPSALKYLIREDYLPASMRLDRVILRFVNAITLDPAEYLSGSDKGLAKRLSERIQQVPPRPNLALGLEEPTLQHILKEQIDFILDMIGETLQAIGDERRDYAGVERYLASTIQHLDFWRASLSTLNRTLYTEK